MDNSTTRTANLLQLSMFERVVIAVIAAAMAWIGVTVTKNAVAIARLEERTTLVSTEIALIKNKIDRNILPVADVRLTAVENRLSSIERTMRQLQKQFDTFDHDHESGPPQR